MQWQHLQNPHGKLLLVRSIAFEQSFAILPPPPKGREGQNGKASLLEKQEQTWNQRNQI